MNILYWFLFPSVFKIVHLKYMCVNRTRYCIILLIKIEYLFMNKKIKYLFVVLRKNLDPKIIFENRIENRELFRPVMFANRKVVIYLSTLISFFFLGDDSTVNVVWLKWMFFEKSSILGHQHLVCKFVLFNFGIYDSKTLWLHPLPFCTDGRKNEKFHP